MTDILERRTFTGDVEVRDMGDHPTVVGYAAKFGVRSQDLGGFIEVIDPAAFNRTVTQADIRGLFNHDPNHVLGRAKAGTLRLQVDSVGLGYEIDLPDTTTGRDVRIMLERGDVSGSSFGFRTVDDSAEFLDDGRLLRTLKEVSLRDVGPVTFPAYTQADSALRSFAEARSLDLDAVVAAAAAGELRELVTPTEDPQPAAPAAPALRARWPRL